MKNKIMEQIQLSGEVPENGINYIEQVERIGGFDHLPRFEATVGFNKHEISVTGDAGESKKAILKKGWRQLCEEMGYND